MTVATCVCLAFCVAAATAVAVGVATKEPIATTEACQPDKLTVYKVVLHTFWSRDKFPKHYPDWRPPAQWSKVFVTEIRTNLAVIIVSFICIFYTSIGGLKAVVWTDNFQFIIVAVIYVTVLVLGVRIAGGVSNVWTKALDSKRLDIFDFDLDPTRRDTFWVIIIGLTLNLISFTSIDQSAMQKLFSVPKYSDAVMLSLECLLLWNFYIPFYFYLSWTYLYAKYGDCDPLSTQSIESIDQLLPLLVSEISQEFSGLASIFVIAAFTASLSSQSTFLNCVSGIICEDFLLKFFKIPGEKLSTVIKLTVVVVGIISTSFIFVVEYLRNIFPIIIGLTGITISPVLGMFMLGFLFPKTNAKGCFYGAISSLVVVLAIAVPAAYYELQGLFEYSPKPLSTNSCVWTNETTIVGNNTMILSTQQIPDIFRISFYYYAFIGCSVTIIAGLIVSCISKKDDFVVDRNLISPIVSKIST